MRIQGVDNGRVFEMTVNETGHAQVEAISESTEEHNAHKGVSFIAHAECHLATASAGGLLFLTNDSTTKEIVITRLYFCSYTLTSGIALLQIKNPATKTGGTDISSSTAFGITQKNYRSSTTADATLKASDSSSDITYTGGQQYHALVMPSETHQTRNMMGTNILGATDTVLFGWKTLNGGNATDGEIIAISINFFLRDI